MFKKFRLGRERLMATIIPLMIALAVGLGGSMQIALIGGMGRSRTAPEAAFTSTMATAIGIALVLAIRAWRSDTPLFSAPLDRTTALLAVAAVAGVLLALSMKGLHPAYAVTGLFATAFLIGTAALVPRLGVALFFTATTAGTLMGALIFDQIGAFGASAMPLSPFRVLGVLAVLVGVALFRAAP